LSQRGFEEISASTVEQIAELELSGTERLGAGVGDQQTGHLLQQFFGVWSEHVDKLLNFSLLLLG
jgi:hypothetical protein